MIFEDEIIDLTLDEDLLISLNNLSEAVEKISNGEKYHLKWAVIFSHSVVQTAMCLCLDVVDSRLVRKHDSYSKDYGDLDTIEWLYQKLLKPEFAVYVGSKVIDEIKFPISVIYQLQIVRNKFIHQFPSRYVFTTSELIELVEFSVNLVRFLVSESERMALGPVKGKIEAILSKIEGQRCLALATHN